MRFAGARDRPLVVPANIFDSSWRNIEAELQKQFIGEALFSPAWARARKNWSYADRFGSRCRERFKIRS
jgi:hypothetical protein